MSDALEFDFIIVGSGPGGQEAATQALRSGKSVALIEKERDIGGHCLHHGTIPSQTLRETANNLARFAKHATGFDFAFKDNVQVESLMSRKDAVRNAHVKAIAKHIHGVSYFRGKGRMVDPYHVEITDIKGNKQNLRGKFIVIATGSRPRSPDNVPVDHEHILDSDSILSMIYLPSSLVVFGAGVIACEYATIFASLGVQVTLVDSGDRPLKFLDPELTDRFVKSFEEAGGVYLGNEQIDKVEWDGVANVVTKLKSGKILLSQKALVALGRVANVEILQPQNAGLALDKRSLLVVNKEYQTLHPHIYAVGDVIGFPALASTSMEQGRRAVCHALGINPGSMFENVPMGIYTIPEISAIGLTEQEALAKCGKIYVGKTDFREVARGEISDIENGLLKLVTGPDGREILGAHIIGEGATELIHLTQMAILAKLPVDVFIENVMNFPTLAEAYRIAALSIRDQREADERLAAADAAKPAE